MDQEALQQRLAAKVERDSAGTSRLLRLYEMSEGHAGLTFGFSVLTADGGEADFILKMAPPGVARRDNTDVFRQAPLLRAMRAAGLPVPGIAFASGEDDELGTSYIVMERLPGRPFLVWVPDASFPREGREVAMLWAQAAQVLAAIHRFDWKRAIPDWQPARLPEDELAHWCRIFDRSDDARVGPGRTLAQTLLDHLPPPGPVGVCHGDFQPGNVLYRGLDMTGVIDWDLSGIGAQALDLGWLLMMAHGPGWAADWQPVGAPPRDRLIDLYRQAGGASLENIEWFEALACFRMAAIACFNLRLHRTGRRVDDIWERFSPSVEPLLARGMDLSRAFRRPVSRAV